MKLAQLIHQLQKLQLEVGGDAVVLIPPPQEAWPPMPEVLGAALCWSINGQNYILMTPEVDK